MSKTNVSRCTIPAKNKDNLYVKVKNNNDKLSRQFTMNVYEKDSSTKELLPVYADDQLTNNGTLDPGAEKVYKIDATSVEGKVAIEIIQEMGGSGIKVSRNSKNPSSVELHIK